MDRPRIVDETEFANEVNRIYGKSGPLLLVVVKATFVLAEAGGELRIAREADRSPVRLVDEMWGLPATTPIRYPCDWFDDKPGTDVVFVGSAWAPNGTAAPRFEAALTVGSLTSRLTACGPRVFGEKGDAVSQPRPATVVPVRWDLAWGGLSTSLDGRVAEEPRNPLGVGVALDRATLTHSPAPQLEEVGKPIRDADGSTPVGFGAIGRHFEPRRSRAGTYDKRWQEERAPLPPADADPLAQSVAAPGLHSPRAFQGGEAIELVNLTPGGGRVALSLPPVDLRIELRARGREALVAKPVIDTVIIDASEPERALLRVELVYRASIPAPARLADAEVFIDEEL